jgi:poly-gamma-glutamate synthesis protein (capsule biosynthesis protein)
MSADMPDNAATLTLVAGGDVGPMIQPVNRLTELIAPVLATADFRFGQCERTYSERGFYPRWTTIPGGQWSRLPADYADLFKTANFDVVSLASNHALDWSYEPMFDTVELFRSWGMQVVGAGHDGPEARQPAIIEKDGVRVAILAYCSVIRDGQAAADGVPGISSIRVRTWYEPNDFQPGSPPNVRTEALAEDVAAAQADIRAAKEVADAVVVSIHWGIRHVPKVLAEYQQPVGHALMDAGADVILGHHAHTPKAVEEYRDSICFYSIGNFMTTGRQTHKEPPNARWGVYWFQRDPDESDDQESLYGFPTHCRYALLPKLTFSKAGVQRVAAIPMYINQLAQPEPLTSGDPRFQDSLDNLEYLSDQHKHTFRVEGDEIVIRG